MRKFFNCFLFVQFLVLSAQAQHINFPAPGHEGLNTKEILSISIDSNELRLGIWTQNRILYNFSNIPGPANTTIDNTEAYDFFRQRFRFGLDVNFHFPENNSTVGAYTQLEYRGGWGGSSPEVSDPRELDPIINPFNRLQPRGVRYGFLYYNCDDNFNFSAGIIPLTDQVGRVLFDADWDFNVGGLTVGGTSDKSSYRIAYVRLLDMVGSDDEELIGDNNHLLVGDYSHIFSDHVQAGIHGYWLTGTLDQAESEFWLAPTLTYHDQRFTSNAIFIYNQGKLNGADHNGYAAVLGGSGQFGKIKGHIQGVMTSGDEGLQVENRFMTLHELLGTGGYWGYTHIFTPSGPSDVNDFGLTIGNSGYGLITIQSKVDFPLYKDKFQGQIFGGWFQANKKRLGESSMGTEIGGMVSYEILKYMKVELGSAFVRTGEFYSSEPQDIFEIFSRFQFTW